MPKCFYYPTAITTSVAFFHFWQPCCLEELFGCLFGASSGAAMFLAAVLCAYCAATMKLLWTLTSMQPTLQLRVECCDHGVCIVCSVAGMIFASPFKFSHDMRRRSIFIYLGPITTSVGFHFFCQPCGLEEMFIGDYLVPQQRWGHTYAEWVCLFLPCFSRIAGMKLLCCDTGLQETPFYN